MYALLWAGYGSYEVERASVKLDSSGRLFLCLLAGLRLHLLGIDLFSNCELRFHDAWSQNLKCLHRQASKRANAHSMKAASTMHSQNQTNAPPNVQQQPPGPNLIQS
jgi:hypothetical protein